MPGLRKAPESRSADAPAFKLVVDILGGPKVLKWKLRGPLDAHELLLRGLPPSRPCLTGEGRWRQLAHFPAPQS